MKCPNCGKNNPDNNKICYFCNTPLPQANFNYIPPEPTQQEINSYHLSSDDVNIIITRCWENHFKNNLSYYGFTYNDLENYIEWQSNLAKSTLTANLIPNKPMSPTSSAIIGSAIGGTVVGIAAGLDAINKEQKYQQSMEKYYKGQEAILNDIHNANYYLNEILESLRKSEKAMVVHQEEEQKYIIEKIKENKLAFYNSQLNAPKYSDPKKESDGCIVVIIILIFLGVIFGMVITHI